MTMAADTDSRDTFVPTGERLLSGVNYLVYTLAFLLLFALAMVGSVAFISEIKGTWHWALHLESAISYLGVFVWWVLGVLVPLTVVKFLGRWYVHD